MKKFVVGIMFTLLATLGLSTVGAETAGADPYPGTVPTTTTVKYRSAVRKTHHFSMKVVVSAAGSAKPTGTVQCKVKRKGGGFKYKKTKPYAGAKVKFKTRSLRKTGKYKFTCTYQPPAASVFQPSSQSGRFKVRQGHR